jgi:hypothetical protein
MQARLHNTKDKTARLVLDDEVTSKWVVGLYANTSWITGPGGADPCIVSLDEFSLSLQPK